MRLQDCWRNLVVLRHGAMHSKYYRLWFRRKIRPPHRALHALNAHMRSVNHVGHDCGIVSRKDARRAEGFVSTPAWSANSKARICGRGPDSQWFRNDHASLTQLEVADAWFYRKAAEVDGVIFDLPQEEDVLGWDYPRLRKFLDERSIPYLMLRDESSDAIAAFVERLPNG